ncbi:MAG: hypothetical protein KTR24_06990 [Saprospiraceae bacterium]|nr:hypothetical protein [Saprospiraceae bacterium]
MRLGFGDTLGVSLWMKRLLPCTILVTGFLLGSSIYGQTEIAFELQAYPTGLIPGLRLEHNASRNLSVHLRLGYQLIDHRGLGKHEDEKGHGYGGTLGFSRYFGTQTHRWHWGLRNDVWFNSIDWRDDLDRPNPRSGTTEITVIQPTAHIGYRILPWSDWSLTPSLAFGYEINVKTRGEPTGEGPILLVGISLGRQL